VSPVTPTSAEIIDLLPDAIVVLDAERTITAVNDAAAELLVRPAKDLLGASADETLEPRTRDGKLVWADGWPRAALLTRVRRIPEQEVDVLAGDGRSVRVAVTGRYRRNGAGRLEGVVLSLRPIERRNTLAASGVEVVSTVSHELRSPLTSVKGYTSLLLNRWDRLDDDQKRSMLEQVQHDADRVTRLITELLDISRLETGRLRLRCQMVDIAALAEVVVEKVRIGHPELAVSVSFPGDLPRAPKLNPVSPRDFSFDFPPHDYFTGKHVRLHMPVWSNGQAAVCRETEFSFYYAVNE